MKPKAHAVKKQVYYDRSYLSLFFINTSPFLAGSNYQCYSSKPEGPYHIWKFEAIFQKNGVLIALICIRNCFQVLFTL